MSRLGVGRKEQDGYSSKAAIELATYGFEDDHTELVAETAPYIIYG